MFIFINQTNIIIMEQIISITHNSSLSELGKLITLSVSLIALCVVFYPPKKQTKK